LGKARKLPLALTIKEVEHVALLGRLNLTQTEKETYAQQLSSILDYVEMINRLPTEGVEPLAHVLPVFNVTRKDATRPSLSKDEVMANAPLQEEGQFKVPRLV
jgi:aspartyl-tRNA(Asn)/glutamyl-tRNA(Gln) amidotransferase subunit C